MVSVIIPCHNCAAFIDRAIYSVLNQAYQVAEIILINNNSTDNTLQVLTEWQTLYPELISVYDEPRSGAPAARNNGLYKAKGDWIQFLDADDELLPDKIARQVNMATQTKADMVAGECLLKYSLPNSAFTIVRHVKKDIWKGLITSNLGITSSNLWRRVSLLAIKGWDESMTSSQEYDLIFRLLKNNGKVAVDNAQNTIVHFSGNSVSKSTNCTRLKAILNNRINLRLRIKNELRHRNLLTPDMARAVDTYIYTEIMNNYDSFPDYANSLLQQYHLRISPVLVLRLKMKRLIKNFQKPVPLPAT